MSDFNVGAFHSMLYRKAKMYAQKFKSRAQKRVRE